MKLLRKIAAGAFCLFTIIAAAGCNAEIKNEKLSVVATIFPEYDWVMNILGEENDSVEVTLLLSDGVDLHNYQPTVADIATISTCDLFIYVGGESDRWVSDALKNALNKDMAVVELLEVLGDDVKDEEIKDGMQTEPEEEEEEQEADEHVWLSVRNAAFLTQEIAAELGRLDPDNADAYAANALSYKEKLSALDDKFKQAVEEGNQDTLIFGDRFPFRYLTDDYGLDYYAAFSGCSAETEASFETIVFLAQKADELGVKCILTIEGTTHSIAQTVVANTKEKNQKILVMDSMQSVTSADVKNGATYLSLMEKNLSVLKEALL